MAQVFEIRLKYVGNHVGIWDLAKICGKWLKCLRFGKWLKYLGNGLDILGAA